MPQVEITKSDNPKKKYKIVLTYDDGKRKTIHIGQAGADDFTKTGDEEAKKRYISRHKKREDWTDYTTRGFWAYHLLWRFSSKQEAVKKIAKQFNLKIDLKV